MAFWQRLLSALGFSRGKKRIFRLDAGVVRSMEMLADRQQRPVEDVASDLLNMGLSQSAFDDDRLRRWHTLSPREQDVAALICLGYTNRQIAARLGISPATVKSHVTHMLQKYGLHSKVELASLLADWDFSAWE